jgi:hypothetical protein
MFAFKEEEKGGCSIFPNLRCELASSSRLVLFFMKPLVNVTPVGAWDYGRMRSCTYMKEGNSTREASFWVWEEEKAKFPMILFLLSWWEMCALVF